MSSTLNLETNERDNVIETRIEIPLGGGVFVFHQPLPRYIYDKLTQDDWHEIGVHLREHAAGVVKRLVLTGEYFAPNGTELARQAIMQGAREMIHRKFRDRNVQAGNMQWAVPSLLKGDLYK